MAGKGKKTPFDGMTHEQMLAWLDAADAESVQGAADRLAAAAKEINSIAEELQIRPQWVKWKGKSADSFRTWAADLAKSTLSLSEYSEHQAHWLGQAAQAIGRAKTSVPRDKGVDANIDAAKSAHNDPDAQDVLSKNMAVRQQTADELEKLGQAYSLSKTQMQSSKPRKFPPPPLAIQDPAAHARDGGSKDFAVGGGGGTGAASSTSVVPGHATTREAVHSGTGGSQGSVETRSPVVEHTGTSAPVVEHTGTSAPVVSEERARMDVDSVDVRPQTQTAPTPPSVSGTPGPGGSQPMGQVPVPPAYGITGGTPPSARGQSTSSGSRATPTSPGGTNGRSGPSTPSVFGRPTTNAPSAQGATGTRGPGGSSMGRGPAQSGVTGGRAQPTTDKPGKGMPRGTVMGNEGANSARGSTGGRGPAQGAGGQRSAGSKPGVFGADPRGAATGRSTPGTTGQKGGIVGGRPQQQRANTRSFSEGGSGLVRGSAGSVDDRGNGGTAGRGGPAPSSARPGKRDEEEQSRRPDYVTEDETTWQPDARRNVPRVVADDPKTDER
ncbi:hypothetical protein ACIRF8_02765 [Streptomyces sp. NPDC102406]|uniref:hypothetical protein n=1 Tax=Streptomyces sp. NPDC102406 TaxID=3366171 RepID=UPI00382AB15F